MVSAGDYHIMPFYHFFCRLLQILKTLLCVLLAVWFFSRYKFYIADWITGSFGSRILWTLRPVCRIADKDTRIFGFFFCYFRHRESSLCFRKTKITSFTFKLRFIRSSKSMCFKQLYSLRELFKTSFIKSLSISMILTFTLLIIFTHRPFRISMVKPNTWPFDKLLVPPSSPVTSSSSSCIRVKKEKKIN